MYSIELYFQLSRLQGHALGEDASQSKSYPNSAQVQEQSRKTWSAPNKDPFGPRHDLTNLADPMGRRSQVRSVYKVCQSISFVLCEDCNPCEDI